MKIRTLRMRQHLERVHAMRRAMAEFSVVNQNAFRVRTGPESMAVLPYECQNPCRKFKFPAKLRITEEDDIPTT
jgi:hypothetical protein